MLIRIW